MKIKNREKRFPKKNENLRCSRMAKKNFKKAKEKKHDIEIKKKRRAVKNMKVIEQKLINKVTRLETKKSLNPKKETELNRLHLTMTKTPQISLEEYSLANGRVELSSLHKVRFCLMQQTSKACEPVVLDAIQRLM